MQVLCCDKISFLMIILMSKGKIFAPKLSPKVTDGWQQRAKAQR